MWFVDDVVAKHNEELRKEKDQLNFLCIQLRHEKEMLSIEKSGMESQKKNLERKLEETQVSLKSSKDRNFFLKLDLDSAKDQVKKTEKELREAQESVLVWRGRALVSASEALFAKMQANNSIERTLQKNRERRLNAEIKVQKTLNASQMIQIRTRDEKLRDLERVVDRQRLELERRLEEVKRVEDEMELIVAALACRVIDLYGGSNYA